MKKFWEINQELLDVYYFKTSSKNVPCIDYLKRNNLYDFYITRFYPNNPDYVSKLEHVEKLVSLFNLFQEKTGKRFFVMKSFLNYPFIDDDLDFVILDNGFKDYERELFAHGFSHNRSLADFREPMKRLYKHPSFEIKAHMHEEISWNGIVLCDKYNVFNNSVNKKLNACQVKIPSPTDELLIAVGHFIFENYYFKIGDFIYFDFLLKSNPDIDRLLYVSEKNGFRGGIYLFFGLLSAFSQIYDLRMFIDNRLKTQKFIIKPGKLFPYFIPYYLMWGTYKEKLIHHYRLGDSKNIPRQLFTYCFVGTLWKYLLPIVRKRKDSLHFQEWMVQGKAP